MKAKHSQSDSDWSNYRHSRNNVSKLIRESNKSYFNKKMSENKHNNYSKKLWDLIKGLTHELYPSKDSIECIKCERGHLKGKESIANELNLFFVKQPIDLFNAQNIGEDIAASNYCKGTQSGNALKIPHIAPKRVVEIFLSVPPHKATGDDEISAKLSADGQSTVG